jgi:hypothetical protein
VTFRCGPEIALNLQGVAGSNPVSPTECPGNSRVSGTF